MSPRSALRTMMTGVIVALVLGACTRTGPEPGNGTASDSAASANSGPVATVGPDDPLMTTSGIDHAASHSGSSGPGTPTRASDLPGRFDATQIPESRARLPPFPLLPPPPGLRGLHSDREGNLAAPREHMIAGERVTALEGRAYRERFLLAPVDSAGRQFNEAGFHRHYADAVRALGGVAVSQRQYTPAVIAAFGGRAAVDAHYHGACASLDCRNHTYLIRQGGHEYWIQVSSGGIPPHGHVTVLERSERRGSRISPGG